MTDHDAWAAHLDPGEPSRLHPDDPAAAGLDRVGAALADATVWSEPPPALRDRLLAAAVAEADWAPPAGPSRSSSPGGVAPNVTGEVTGGDVSGYEAPVRPGPGPNGGPSEPESPVQLDEWRRPERPRRTGRRVIAGAGLVAAGAAAAVAALTLVPRLSSGDEVADDPFRYQAAPTELVPGASAEFSVVSTPSGEEITLWTEGLPAAPEGRYYAAWLVGPEGPVPVGTFHMRRGEEAIDLWSGVDTERYPNFMVTLQSEGEPPTPSDQVMLRGQVGPADE